MITPINLEKELKIYEFFVWLSSQLSHIAAAPSRRHLFPMSTQSQLSEISRLLLNLIRTGVVSEVDTDGALCRVQTGEIQTGWINWLARRAGRSRDWWAPSVGEQVLLLAVGGELDTAFVLTGIYYDDFPAPPRPVGVCRWLARRVSWLRGYRVRTRYRQAHRERH